MRSRVAGLFRAMVNFEFAADLLEIYHSQRANAYPQRNDRFNANDVNSRSGKAHLQQGGADAQPGKGSK